jgi:hypothetical protein
VVQLLACALRGTWGRGAALPRQELPPAHVRAAASTQSLAPFSSPPSSTPGQESVLCVPMDRRLPLLRLRSRQLAQLLGRRLVLRVAGWDRASRYPTAHLVRVLGPINDLRRAGGAGCRDVKRWQQASRGPGCPAMSARGRRASWARRP